MHETSRREIRAGEGPEQGALVFHTLFPATKSHPILGDRADLTREHSHLHAFFQMKSRNQFIYPLVRQPVIRLYSVPANAFTEEEEEEGAEDADEPELVI